MKKTDIVLSQRMQAVVNMIDEGLKVADIGCDHAYVSIYLMQRSIAAKVIAMDIGKGPLEIAKRNIAEYGYSETITTRLSDGADELLPKEADATIIAGMGGMLMEKILLRGEAVFREMKQLVLQPQSDLAHFRRFLKNNNYRIIDEDMVLEDGKYYPVIKAVYDVSNTLCETDVSEDIVLSYGPVLTAKRHPVLKQFLKWEKAQYEEVLTALNSAKENDGIIKRKKEIEALYYVNQTAFSLFDEE